MEYDPCGTYIGAGISNADPSITQYQWYLNTYLLATTTDPNLEWFGSGLQTGARSLYVKVTNACGTTQSLSRSLTIQDCGGGQMLVASPNPAGDELNISIENFTTDNTEFTDKEAVSPEYDLQFYDKYSQVRMTGKTTKGKLRLDTSNLPADTYFLHARRGNEIIRKQIVVQH